MLDKLKLGQAPEWFANLTRRQKLIVISISLLFSGGVVIPPISKLVDVFDKSDDICTDENWLDHLPDAQAACINDAFETEFATVVAPSNMGMTRVSGKSEVSIYFNGSSYEVSVIENGLTDSRREYNDSEEAAYTWINEAIRKSTPNSELVAFDYSYAISNTIISEKLGLWSEDLAALQESGTEVFDPSYPNSFVFMRENITDGELIVYLSTKLHPQLADRYPMAILQVPIFQKGMRLIEESWNLLSFLPEPVLAKMKEYAAAEV